MAFKKAGLKNYPEDEFKRPYWYHCVRACEVVFQDCKCWAKMRCGGGTLKKKLKIDCNGKQIFERNPASNLYPFIHS